MDGQILGPAALDDSSAPSRAIYHVDRQYDGDQVLMEGSVTLLLDRHPSMIILRPQLRVNATEYTWYDESNKRALCHRFNNPMRYHHIWKSDETRTSCTVDFDMSVISASKIQCSKDGHSPHSNHMLSYVFASPADYQRFQTMIRGKTFGRDYDIKSIDCDRSNTLKQKDQCIKSWRSNGDLSLTIPVSVRSTGSAPAWKIEHIEIMASWMEWQVVKPKSVKATYRTKRSSMVHQPGRDRGHVFSWRRASQPVPASHTQEITTASPDFRQQWPSFVIDFSNSAGKISLCHHWASLTYLSTRRILTRSQWSLCPIYTILAFKCRHYWHFASTSIINICVSGYSNSTSHTTHKSLISAGC